MPTTATPTILRDPGYLFWAPIGSAEPTNTVVASKFTDAWPVAWISLGATQDGNEFSWSSPVEPVYAAEFLDPLVYVPAEASGKMSFALQDYTLNNLKKVLNGGSLTVVSGTTTTELNKFEPPDPADLTRAMIGWESLDNTLRFIGRQMINGGEMTTSHKKGTDIGLIPFEMNFERPAAAKSWVMYGTSTRKGA